ncbi:MAG: hypothetical protein PHD26_04225 [Methanosarcinaceae archaeon]|nr:hypothetical protein [Methanosarcinaceae archaeon]
MPKAYVDKVLRFNSVNKVSLLRYNACEGKTLRKYRFAPAFEGKGKGIIPEPKASLPIIIFKVIKASKASNDLV